MEGTSKKERERDWGDIFLAIFEGITQIWIYDGRIGLMSLVDFLSNVWISRGGILLFSYTFGLKGSDLHVVV